MQMQKHQAEKGGSAAITVQSAEGQHIDFLEVVVSQESENTGVAVSGSVKSYSPQVETTVTLLREGDLVDTVIIALAAGSGQVEQAFTFEDVAPGTYDLDFQEAGHTRYTLKNVVVSEAPLSLTKDPRASIKQITLLCGDNNDDGVINVTDLNIVWSAANYNKSADAATNSSADLNGDGVINVTDLNILWSAANYNKGAVVFDYREDIPE